MNRSAFVSALIVIVIQASHAAEAKAPFAILAEDSVLRPILVDPSFRHGMQIPELERVIESNYVDWIRSERTRPINNQNDPDLPQHASTPYLQSVLIEKPRGIDGITRGYKFYLTSPLSQARIYSIVYDVEAQNVSNGLMSLQDWMDAYYSRFGYPRGVVRTAERARVTYFFSSNGEPIHTNKCDTAYDKVHRLDRKTPHEVQEIVEFLKERDCAYSVDNIVLMNGNGEVYKSTLYLVDFAANVNDVAKRVSFGRQ